MSRPPTPPPPFLTTKEVAELLRVRERKVYDLAAAGEIPNRRVTGKLLFPRVELERWLETGVVASHASAAAVAAPNVIAGSSDPLLDWALRESGCGMASWFDGSLDGLARVADGAAAACGLHVIEADGAGWNQATIAARLVEDRFVLIEWARRTQGLMVRPELVDQVRAITDLPGRRVAARQPGAGARILLERLLAQSRLEVGVVTLIDPPPRTEAEAAEHVAQGKADAALGLQSMAARLGLGFVALIEERFDLLIERRAYFEPPLQRLLRFADDAAFATKAAELGGYDLREFGEVRWNGSAEA